jgi:hypothetical protein
MRRSLSLRLTGCAALALSLVLLSGERALAQRLLRPAPPPQAPVPLRPPGSNNQPGLAPDGLLSPSGAAGSLDRRGVGTGSLPSLAGQGTPSIAGVPGGTAFGTYSPYGASPYANPYAYGAYPYGGVNPYAVNPYAANPYGAFPPYGGVGPYGMAPYGAVPPYGAVAPFGAANPYANPFVNPFVNPFAGFGAGMPLGGGNAPLGGMNPGFGGINPLGQ